MRWITIAALTLMWAKPVLAADSTAILLYDGDDAVVAAELQTSLHQQFATTLPEVKLVSVHRLGVLFHQLTSVNTAADQIPFDDLLKAVSDLVFDGEFKRSLAMLQELQGQTRLAKNPPERRITIELWRTEIYLAQRGQSAARRAVDAALVLDPKLVVDLSTFTPDVAKAVRLGRKRIKAQTELKLVGLLRNSLVRIDGEGAGTAPFAVAPGDHWLEIQLNGFHSIKRWVKTPSARINMAVKLPPNVRTLVVQAAANGESLEEAGVGLERIRQRLRVSTLLLVHRVAEGSLRAAVYPKTRTAPQYGLFADTAELMAWAATAVPQSAAIAQSLPKPSEGPARSWTTSVFGSAGVTWWAIRLRNNDDEELYNTFGAGPGAQLLVGLERASWRFEFSGAFAYFGFSETRGLCIPENGDCPQVRKGGNNVRLQFAGERRFGERFFLAPRVGVLMHAFLWNDLVRPNGPDLGALDQVFVVAPEAGLVLGLRRGDLAVRGVLVGRFAVGANPRRTVYGARLPRGPGLGAGVSLDWRLSRWIVSAGGRIDWYSLAFNGEAAYSGAAAAVVVEDVKVNFTEPVLTLGLRREF